jgi:nitrogen regulatory protein P-II 1
MKEIRAIVRKNKQDRLRETLRKIPNFPGVTIYRAEGFTAPSAVTKRTIRDELTDFTEKLVVCVLCEDDMVEPIRHAIIESCQTGMIGDGLVWVVDVQAMHRVRDSQRLDVAPLN